MQLKLEMEELFDTIDKVRVFSGEEALVGYSLYSLLGLKENPDIELNGETVELVHDLSKMSLVEAEEEEGGVFFV